MDNPVINRFCLLQSDPDLTPAVLRVERYKGGETSPLTPPPPAPQSSAAEGRKGKDVHFVHLGYRNCDFCHLESFMLRQWSVNMTFFYIYKCL